MHNTDARSEQAGQQEQLQEAPTLAQVVAASSALGIRRLILIALQLTTELDLVEQSGLGPARIDLESVWLERIGTPFEQAFLQRGRIEWQDADTLWTLRQLGALLLQLLEKPSYLESAGEAPPSVELRQHFQRGADRKLVNALRRALRLIARHCLREDAAYYASAFDVAADLARLAHIASASVARRRVARPIVGIHIPRPRMSRRVRRLPKVIVDAARPHLAGRVERLWRTWAASLRLSPVPA